MGNSSSCKIGINSTTLLLALGAANTMCSVAEAMCMCLPGSANIPATYATRVRSAQVAGRQTVELVHRGIIARQIFNRQGVENAFRPGRRFSGSMNLAMHILAIANEADCGQVTMDVLEELSRSTPYVAKTNPAAAYDFPIFMPPAECPLS
jgi:dihydroxy-acid dehydratase